MTKTKSQKARAKAALNSKKSQVPATKLVVVEKQKAEMIRPKSIAAEKVYPRMGANHSSTVLGMTLPHAFATPRLSTVYADVPTAIANPFLLESVDWSTPSEAVDRMIPKGTFYMAASRSPLQALIRFHEYLVNQVSQYRFNFATPEDPQTNFTDTFSFEINLPTGALFPYDITVNDTCDPQFLVDDHWQDPLYSHPHGYRYYTVDANGRKGFWVSNSNSQLLFEVLSTNDPLTMEGDTIFRLSKWDGSTWARTGYITRVDFALGPGSVNFLNIPNPGYWSLDVEFAGRALDATAQFLKFGIRLQGVGPQFGISTMPKLENVESSVQSMRTTAVSLMLTQRAPFLTQGGQVTGVQLPSGEPWYAALGAADPFDELSNYTSAVTRTLDTGIYGFLKPASQPEFNFFSPYEIIDGEVVGYINPIEPPGSWLVVVANVVLVTGSYAGGLAHLTASYGVEFVTDNIWFSSLPSTISPDAFTKALMELKNTQQWHENPMHFKELLRSAMSAGKTALRMAPTIAKMVSQFIPGVNPSVAVMDALSKLGHAL